MSKSYCTCKGPNSFTALWNPYKEEQSMIFVHSICRLPTKEVWLTFVSTCDNCFKDFSFPETEYSPWGPLAVTDDLSGDHEGDYLCARCFRAEHGPEPVYRGWKWASRQLPPWYPAQYVAESVAEIESLGNKPLDNLVGTL